MSSPMRPGAGMDLKEQVQWYKTNYEQLEADLADFQASSKELEEQMEKDLMTVEKSERKWKEQVEKLQFEVEEWKTKHKQAKAEANNAQNKLQKEITAMRDTIRSQQSQLRDTEVMNDDYERQARNTETSLEDLESKYNASIERGVMFEETIRQSEQEREELRIETQRLRDDLGDLKVESEITREKLRLAEETVESLRARKPSTLAVESLRTRSPASEASGITPTSPTASTPPPKSDSASDMATPPSPPLSDAPATARTEMKTPMPKRSHIPDSTTPRPSFYGSRTLPRHTRGPSLASSSSTALSDAKSSKAPAAKPRVASRTAAAEGLPRSESLYQIRGLIGRMQKIEERVHSARSKLPATGRTPTGSPRAGSSLSNHIPSSITMRRSSKRPSGSTSSALHDDDGGSSTGASTRRDSHIKRLSYGIPRPASSLASRSERPERPPSAMEHVERPPSSAADRPSSRASLSGRPPSRSGARTELGHYSSSTIASSGASSRPRSSMGGTYANGTPRGHRTSASFSEARKRAAESEDSGLKPSPGRRNTIERSGIPGVSALPTPRNRQSGGLPQRANTASRTSNTFSQVREEDGAGQMGPPPSRKRMSDVGETY
ncbi:uncharacterized protein RCC_10703 [Ramularia collo-cygni]|uniref:NUDE domain-containing protein n=1 Tax=Ramularia collo-cygni TaxID=112498 RepID=A0A2D3VPF3_9PEZI|nr:uncharacterized protein RCC_10703 [Ramularia collo-cygni]CZT24974.1 uncharacterized protein RCC_10703 [Ramularia collo-cygni]